MTDLRPTTKAERFKWANDVPIDHDPKLQRRIERLIAELDRLHVIVERWSGAIDRMETRRWCERGCQCVCHKIAAEIMDEYRAEAAQRQETKGSNG